MNSIQRFLSIAAALSIIIPAAAHAGEITNAAQKRKILTSIRERYYDARKATSKGLEATVRAAKPTRTSKSETVLRKLEERMDSALAAMTFFLSIPSTGDPSISGPPDADENGASRNALSSVDQMLTNALVIWLTTKDDGAIPANDDCKVFKEKKGYRLVFGSGSGKVTTTLTDDFTVTRVEADAEGDAMVMTPTFAPSEQGLLLKHVGIKSKEGIDLEVAYTHELIQGAYLPIGVDVTARFSGVTFVLPMTITNYRLGIE